MTIRAISCALGLIVGWSAVNGSAAVSADPATLRFLEQRVKSDPLDSIALNRLSVACIVQMRETGDLAFLDRALQSARSSLAAVPASQNSGGLAALAVAELELHHFREALALARQAYTIDPRNLGALATAGDAELELGDYAEAGKTYAMLSEGDPAPPVRARLARLAELKGDPQNAIALLRQNLGTGVDSVWYRVRLGELHFRMGDLEKADDLYESARRLRPESYLVLEHLAELRAAQGKYDDALALYQKVVAMVPRAEFFQALGDLYVFMKRPAEARPWHDRALTTYLKSVEAGNAHYYHHLAGFYSDVRENPAEALRWARQDKAIRNSIYACDTLAWALYRNGEFAAAAEEMAKALALGTKDAHLLFHAGMIYSRAGQIERGGEFLKQALAANPRYNSFHMHR
ncbi:MAG: tetratricopeptide repeat protein [Opitutaceae bacterium]|nr:tetratricopeptide repeat protein [Verrucomicrobiales bacterium]